MALNFNQEAVNSLFARLVSPCKQIGAFRSSVIQHEPKSAPSAVPALAMWWLNISPPRSFSGLAATAARIEYGARVYLNYQSRSEDETERQLMTLTSQVIGAYSSAFTLDDDVAAVDLLGAWGTPLSATAGYVEYAGDQKFRISEITIPVIADDMWTQEA